MEELIWNVKKKSLKNNPILKSEKKKAKDPQDKFNPLSAFNN